MPAEQPTVRPEYVIADAIAAAINAATFTGAITSVPAVVDEAPDFENLDDPTKYAAAVKIIPAPELELTFSETRGGDLHELDVALVLTKRLANVAERRAMVDLRWQIQDRLRADRDAVGSLLVGVPTWWDLRTVQVSQTFDREGMRGPNVFQAAMLLRFSAVLSR